MRLFSIIATAFISVLGLWYNNIPSAIANPRPNRPLAERLEAMSHGGIRPGLSEFSVWLGISFDSPSGMFLGVTEDRALLVAGFQYARMLAAGRTLAIAHTLDLVPLAVVTNNPNLTTIRFSGGGAGKRVVRSSVYGVGLAPVGLKAYLFPFSKARLFLSTSAGFLSFLEEVPEPDARKFNFTLDFGVGVQISMTSRTALTIGYRLHHLSNANTASVNPGLDSNVFYVGVSSFR